MITCGRHRDVPAHGWEIIKELFKGVSALDIVNQRLNRDAGSNEHRGTTEDVGIGVHNGRLFHAATSQSVG